MLSARSRSWVRVDFEPHENASIKITTVNIRRLIYPGLYSFKGLVMYSYKYDTKVHKKRDNLNFLRGMFVVLM